MKLWDRLVDQMLRGFVHRGTLRVSWPSGTTDVYGQGAPEVHVTIHSPQFSRAVLLHRELALGEGYMNGDLTIEGDDLEGLLKLGTLNKAARNDLWWKDLADRTADALRWVHQRNPVTRSRTNVAHHYDLSSKLYDLFLDADRQYSCAYFPPGVSTLEDAQAAKKHHIARKLLIQPGHRVLDIGCGWGGLALTLARDYGAHVLGVTLSEEQHRIATERVAAAGLSDRIEIALIDYRKVTGTFDRIVSVGMFEHVGVPHYRTYFRQVHDRLTEDGIALIHTIGRSAPPRTTSPWIRKYIFPGGYVPALSEVSKAVERERLWMGDIEVLRLHYAQTLRLWHDRFVAEKARVLELYDERFFRMWRFYLVAAEMTFRHGWQAVFQLQLSRRVDAVPLSRDYLYQSEQSEAGTGMAAQ